MNTNGVRAPRPASGPRVAVVGGGISGLAAAVQLAEHGASVVVLEADRLGGKLRTSRFAGRPVDEAADAFLARVPDATDLAATIGFSDRLVTPTTASARIFLDGHLVPFPAGHLLGLPTDPDATDLAAVLDRDAISRLRDDIMNPGAPPPADADETIGSFIRRRLGDDVLERLIGPLAGGINAGNADALSLAAVTPQLDAVARSTTPSIVTAAAELRAAASAKSTASSGAGDTPPPVFLAPVGGMATFVHALLGHLDGLGVERHEGIVVRSLERLAHGWRVVADPSSGAGVATDSTFEADAVVLAAPAPVTSMIIQDHAPTASAHLGSLSHASIALVTLAIDPPAVTIPLDGSGFVVPRTSGLVLTACSWASSKWAALGPEYGDGTLVFRVSAGRADDRRISELDDDALVQRLVDDLGATMGLDGGVAASRINRWPSSFPQYALGHLTLVDEIEADLAELAPTLAVAGNALRGVGIPACIRSGQVAADRVLAGLTDR